MSGLSMKASLALAIFCACGGAISDPGSDGGADGSIESSPIADGALDSGLQAPCKTSNDCWGAHTCQQGMCCSGKVTNGKCSCGNGPGCDLASICCYWPCDASVPPTCTPISGCKMCVGK